MNSKLKFFINLNNNILVASPSTSYSSKQRQARVIHTSKKKVVVGTKGKTSTKTKTIVTSSVVSNEPPEEDNSGRRRSSRAKQPMNKNIETTPSPNRSLTNGSQRSAKSQAQASASANSKFQRNLLAQLSKKRSNYSPDVVSDLEEILGSPIKTHENRTDHVSSLQSKIDESKINVEMLRVDIQTDDETKPTTRSSKRLSKRIQPIIETVVKTPKSNSRKKHDSISFDVALSIEEHQESQEPFNNLQISNNAPENVVLNIKQEKEVSYTMTDENNVFTCEMCSAVFSDRAQLLVHVPVHI